LFLAGLLIEDQRLLSSEGLAVKQPVEAKIKAAMESLFLETGTYLPPLPYTYEPKKDAFFLRVYLSLSSLSIQNCFIALSNTTTVLVQARIDSAMQSINNKDWKQKKIPSYLFGEMALSPRLAYNEDDKFQLLRAAKNGKKSYFRAQQLYANPSGCKTTADKLLKLAAKQGHREAQYRLGLRYSAEGSERAFYWYNRASEQGHAEAQYELARCYRNGWGIEPDSERAFYWFKQAADRGHLTAKSIVLSIYLSKQTADEGHLTETNEPYTADESTIVHPLPEVTPSVTPVVAGPATEHYHHTA